MDQNNSFVDYYKVLECDRKASASELKRNYQRLVLTLHPDKDKSNKFDSVFLLLQKAWSVLRDPNQRKQYDATLNCYENSELLLYDTVSLGNMDYDSNEDIYTYTCRCGGSYTLCKNDFISSSVVIGCEECSLSILVNR